MVIGFLTPVASNNQHDYRKTPSLSQAPPSSVIVVFRTAFYNSINTLLFFVFASLPKYVLAVCISGGHFYIAYLYTDRFNNTTREHVWPFFTLSAASLALVVYHLLRWKAFAKEIGTEKPGGNGSTTTTTLLQRAKRAKEMFDMNGELFLWKLFILELTEAAMQIYNLARRLDRRHDDNDART